MPMYEFHCEGCGREAEVYETMANALSLLLYCMPCEGRMKKRFSSPMISVPKSLGSKIDKQGVVMPKEWFHEQNIKKQKKGAQDARDALVNDPSKRSYVNKERKKIGLEPL